MKIALLSLILTAVAAGDALATARHDRIQTSPITRGGKTIGANVTLTVHPERYQNVRIGLGRMKARVPAGVSDQGAYKRELAAGVRSGYLRVKLGEKKGLTNKPFQLQFQVLYGKAGLKAGDKVDLVSAFYNETSYFHIYGMFDGPVTRGDTTSVITLPK